MLMRDDIWEKIKSMPDDLVKEIGDFVDFLESKRSKREGSQQVCEESDVLGESNMDSYLTELTAYEDMLVRGEIHWK